MADFTTIRVHRALTADAEKQLLIRIAERLPDRINSDHLTFIGAAAMIGVGVCFWAGGSALWLVIPLLAVNWFGDSLDGTLARVRDRQRPRYGFYVDHVLDVLGFAALFGGLAFGGHMHPTVALGFLASYYLLTTEIALATHARGIFTMSFFGIGPTELRIVLAAGAIRLMRSDVVLLFGHRWLLFDIGAVIGVTGLLLTFIVASVRNGVALYKEEPLPKRPSPAATV
jgi:phosphatidylglycerophosphate synthase